MDSHEQIARRLHEGLGTAPQIHIDSRTILRRGRRRRTFQVAAVSSTAFALVLGMTAAVVAIRPPLSSPADPGPTLTTAAPTSPDPRTSPAPPWRPSGVTFVQTAVGDRFRTTHPEWTFDKYSNVYLSSPLYAIQINEAWDCTAAASCDDWETWGTSKAVGGVTYYQVDRGSMLDWYVDWDNRTFRILIEYCAGCGRAEVTDLVESIDWTGNDGTPVYLPTGGRIGIDLPEDWGVKYNALNFIFNPIGADYDELMRGSSSGPWVTVFPSSCSSAGTCKADYAGRGDPIPDGTRTANGVTYHVTSLGILTAWECEWNGHVYRFEGEPTHLDAFMESVEWIP
ncbi:MAG: hypothetical protein FWH11_15055 [Micrococcales bacterium]|nr:hypothetical protein [Micrococcales bacterium]